MGAKFHFSVAIGFLGLLLLTSSVAMAAPITVVNTGPGTGLAWFVGHHDEGVAGEFTVVDPVTVTSAEGWLRVLDGGTMSVKLCADGGEFPGAELFSIDVALTPSDPAWLGATGLNWLLAPGTYWILLEGTLPLYAGILSGSPFPLGNEATVALGTIWQEHDELDFGFRILGESGSAPIPEPGPMLLLGTGLVGLGRAWRKRRQ